MPTNREDPPPRDGRRTRWDAHRARRREQLVTAALDVLHDVGPEFGLDQVAARAGVTKPVIYRHFGDRAGLVDAMGETAGAALLRDLLPALYGDTPLRTRIHTSVDAFMAFLEASPNVYWIFARPGPTESTSIEGINKELIASALASVFGDVLSEVGRDPAVAQVWARGIVGFVQNVAEWWLERRPMSRAAITEHLTSLLWAQIDGFSRSAGVVLDPDLPLGSMRPATP